MALRVYIEVVILDNFLMDYFLLYALAQCFVPRPKTYRLVLSALLGTVYAVLAPLKAFLFLQSAVCKVASSAVMVWMACGRMPWRPLLARYAAFWALSVFMGGFVMGVGALLGAVRPMGGLLALSGPPLWALLLLGFAACWGGKQLFFALKRRAVRTAHDAHVEVTHRARTVVVQAVLDSGSDLHDPVTGLPVVLLPQSSFAHLCPEGEDALSDCRGANVPYYTASGMGTVQTYAVDQVRVIAGGRVTCVPMLIARMPTQTERQAVVPMHALLCA